MQKNRRVIRKTMLAEKKFIHKIEAMRDKMRDEFFVHRGEVDDGRHRTSFHRPINVAYWRKNKHKREELCYNDHYNAPQCQIRRKMIGVKQRLRENELMIESEFDYTREMVGERSMPRVRTQHVVVRSNLYDEWFAEEPTAEEIANGWMFCEAVFQTPMTPEMIRQQKGNNL